MGARNKNKGNNKCPARLKKMTENKVAILTNIMINMGDQFGSSQLAVWRNGGSNPAEKEVRN
jgi:hypothetical protein